MERIFNNRLSKYLIKKIKGFIPLKSNFYPCLYCGHIYKSRDIKFNNLNNCGCYYKWIYFNSNY